MQMRLIVRRLGHWCCMFAILGLLSTTFSLACAADTPNRTDEAKQRIDELIEQLGDPSFIKREAAREEIERFGLQAFESLRTAEMHENVEISHTATYLLESMQVDWSLPTDSFEVQKLLKDYNELSLRGKLEALQRLASQERADGYAALLRLMRYERDEKISKTAGLHVMESAIDALTKRPDADAASKQPAVKIDWQDLITRGAADSTRVTAQWLRTLADQLDEATIPVDVWQKHVTQERMLLESNSRGRTRTRTKTDDETVKQLYRNVAKLLAAKGQPEAAIDFFEPCFDLVSKETKEAYNDLQWMLEAGLPRAVERLNEQRPDLFATRTRNRYLLAEAYLKLGKTELADKTAAEASDLTTLPSELARRIAKANPGDNEATLRQINFEYLVQRGLFGWGEAELKRILASASKKGEISIQQELSARQRLATFYWGADQPQDAADAWLPIMERAGMLTGDTTDKELQAELSQRNSEDVPYAKYIPAHYYFYLGLAASKEKNWERAREHLRKASEYDATDPDLLIAMYRAAQDDKPFTALVDQSIETLEASLRSELDKAESELAAARSARNTYENIVAMECNQLAWLLSCTNRKVNDALFLSQRACNLMPDYGVYLDTLARCEFAAGHIEKAIELQTRAVKLVPFERSMQRQLEEFRQAKK